MVEPSAKLTKRVVDAALPRPGRYIVWDTELKGFALRVSESGTKSYVLRYRPRGTGRAGPRRFMALGRHRHVNELGVGERLNAGHVDFL